MEGKRIKEALPGGRRGMALLTTLGLAVLAAFVFYAMPMQANADTGMDPAVSTGTETVFLDWDSAGDHIDGYMVMRKTTSQRKWRTAGTVTGGATSFLDSGLKNGKDYEYRILPFDEADDIAATPAAGNVLPVPANVSLQAVLNDAGTAVTGVELSFDDNSLSHMGLISSYAVYRDGSGLSGALYLTPDVSDGRRVWVDTSAQDPETEYSYQVRHKAGKSFGRDAYNSDLSASISITLPAMTPQNPTATIGDDGVTVSWTASPDTKQAVTGHRIYRKGPSDSGMSVHVADTGTADTSYVDSDLLPDTKYVYRVSELVGQTRGRMSKRASVTTPSQLAAPSISQIHLHDGAALLKWGAVDGADGYIVSRRDTGATEWSVVGEKVAGLAFADSTIAPSASYEYSVAALSIVGAGHDSSAFAITTPAMPPRLMSPWAQMQDGKIGISWSEPGTLLGSEGFIGYRVDRSTYSDSSHTTLVESATLDRTHAELSGWFIDSHVVSGHHYVYVLYAVNVMGAGPGTDEFYISVP